MKALYIHIGIHKTGSSAIQRSLKDGASVLESHNVVRFAPRGLLSDLCQSPEYTPQQAEAARRALAGQLPKQADENTVAVLSSENLCGTAMAGYADAPERARRLAMATRGFPVRIICYLRRQDSFIESLYTQSIHEGGHGSFEEFHHAFGQRPFDWNRLLAGFEEHFGQENILVRPYEKAALASAQDIIDDFSSILGITGLAPPTAPRQSNVGYSPAALRLARACNRRLPKDQQARLRYYLQTLSPKDFLNEYRYFNEEQRQEILAEYAQSNADVARKYRPDGPQGFFAPPDEPSGAMSAEDRDREIHAILMQCILELDQDIAKLRNKKPLRRLGRACNLPAHLRRLYDKLFFRH